MCACECGGQRSISGIHLEFSDKASHWSPFPHEVKLAWPASLSAVSLVSSLAGFESDSGPLYFPFRAQAQLPLAAKCSVCLFLSQEPPYPKLIMHLVCLYFDFPMFLIIDTIWFSVLKIHDYLLWFAFLFVKSNNVDKYKASVNCLCSAVCLLAGF